MKFKNVLLAAILTSTGIGAFSQTLSVPGGNTNINSSTGNNFLMKGNNRTALRIGGPSSSGGAIGDLLIIPTNGGKIPSSNGASYWNWSFRSDNWSGFAGDYVLYSSGGTSNSYTSPFIAQADGDVILASGRGARRFGNVGIGTTTPTKKLDVNGTIKTTQGWGDWLQLHAGNGTGFWRIHNSQFQNELVFGHETSSGVSNYFLFLNKNGNVGIGTRKVDGYRLSVAGKVRAEEIEVSASTGWADFVFEDDYELQSLTEVEEYITENNHLPNVPSEKEVTEEGVNLGEMDAILLRKIEELTLYVIDLKKENEAQKQINEDLRELVERK